MSDTTPGMSPLAFRVSRLLSVVTIKTHLKFKFVLFCVALLASSAVFSVLGTKIAIFQMIKRGLFTDDVFIYRLGVMCNLIITVQFFILAVSLFFFILVAHVITGPIFNMERVFDRMKNGDLSMTVRFRKGDDLQITASKLNDALDGLRQALDAERLADDKLLADVARIADELKKMNQAKAAEQLDVFVAKHRELPRAIKTH